MKRDFNELLKKVRETPLEHPVLTSVKEFFDTLQMKHKAWPSLICLTTQTRLLQVDPGMPADTRARLIEVVGQHIGSMINVLFPEEEYRQRMKELIADTEQLTKMGFDAVDQIEVEGETKH